ncbi:MAG: TonB family protein [Phenylobacterium sp.]|uniref:TonB family protein n=1 Tax=Phenylobacterium sp. TaxID=1871053 RepID=UPI0011FC232D|nr:TonB family protein [Phenylobacterium sp.]TAJ71702.1 MAG: TonB family protein [Phenylobacterium sp.]
MDLIAASLLLQAATASLPGEVAEARWKRVPSAYERALAYPSQASKTRTAGQATLKCKINDIGAPAHCSVHSEAPAGYGFGKALMSLRSKMRFHAPKAGEDPWVLIAVRFDPDPRKALLIH